MYVASAFRRTVRAVRLKPDTTYYTVVKSAVGRDEARRPRAKLVRYYREDGRGDETIIELPTGGSAPGLQAAWNGGYDPINWRPWPVGGG
jgi:hypothetical protein